MRVLHVQSCYLGQVFFQITPPQFHKFLKFYVRFDDVFLSIQKSINIKGKEQFKTHRKTHENTKNHEFNLLRWNDVPRTSRIFSPKIAIFSQF